MASIEAQAFQEAISRALDTAAEAISGIETKERLKAKSNLSAHAIVYYNADGSIDGELRVDRVPAGVSVNQVFTQLDIQLSTIMASLKNDLYFQTGVRYRPREGEPVYTKFMGMSQAESYYHGDLEDAIATGKKIDVNMQSKNRRKPEQVFFRVHWNEARRKPDERWPGAGKSPHHPKGK